MMTHSGRYRLSDNLRQYRFQKRKAYTCRNIRLGSEKDPEPFADNDTSACDRRSADMVRACQQQRIPDRMALFLLEQSDARDGRALGLDSVSDEKGKYRFGSLLTALPAAFMTAVSLTYILTVKEGFRLDETVSYIIGAAAAAVLFTVYMILLIRRKNS